MFFNSAQRFLNQYYVDELQVAVDEVSPLTKYNTEMIVVSIGGLLLNLLGLYLFNEDDDVDNKNTNTYALFLHVLADTLGSLSVIVASFFVRIFQWYIADTICALFTSIMIFISVVPLSKMSIVKLIESWNL